MPITFKGISDTYGRLHPRFARAGAELPYFRFGDNQNGNQENCYIILLFLGMELFLLGWNQSGDGAGDDIFMEESESESLKIRGLRSPVPNAKRTSENEYKIAFFCHHTKQSGLMSRDSAAVINVEM